MPPSRGAPKAISNVKDSHASDDHAVAQQGDSALKAAKRNLSYLYDPSHSPTHPTRFRTRALLRSIRYITIFIFWRLVRWAKYIAFGSLIAAVGATAVGGAVTGVAWIAAPPTLGAGIASAIVWQVGKWGARRLNRRWHKDGGDAGVEVRERASDAGDPMRQEGSLGMETGPGAVPW